ncbi:MAG: hypothetical protein DWQ31_05890 [Planctomycetota bacterium]|nr:MAG: hypothetical protein DWQ31_05890 [Planctomycetota bacterium]REJ98543.1 MAG: hypothetical protein DWQ35_00645 [Planctomycetota bacterium]REK29843.1 MAG: hypothetical protein DWQ42_02765 [Planctomycetota bacterium]REK47986.1 MAG: hypothetical protein DWQ46_03590 [Planctomycetota bacterium]
MSASLFGQQAVCPYCQRLVDVADPNAAVSPAKTNPIEQLVCPRCATSIPVHPERKGQKVACPACLALIDPALIPLEAEATDPVEPTVANIEQPPQAENESPVPDPAAPESPAPRVQDGDPSSATLAERSAEASAPAKERPAEEPADSSRNEEHSTKAPAPIEVAPADRVHDDTTSVEGGEELSPEDGQEGQAKDEQEKQAEEGAAVSASHEPETEPANAALDERTKHVLEALESGDAAQTAEGETVAAEFAEFRVEERPLTVQIGKTVVELESVSRKEKRERQLRRNITMLFLCIAVLIGVVLYLTGVIGNRPGLEPPPTPADEVPAENT